MAFVLTLVYVAFALVSPGVLPDAIVALHVNEILGVLTILGALISIPESRFWALPNTYLVLGVLVASVLSVLASGWVGGAVAAFTGFMPIIFTFYFVAIACRSLARLNALVLMLLLVAFFVFGHGAFAYFSGNFESPYLEPETISGSTLYRFRGLGVLSDPNDLAQFFVMLIPLLWLRWKKGKLFANVMMTIVPALVLVVAIYYTHSRGAIVALLAVMLFGFKDKLGLVKSSLLAGVGLLGALALNVSGGRGMNEDDGGRVAAWALGLQTFRAHPIFGVGMGFFGDYNDTGLTAHNSYVLCLAELGIFGYFFWMGMLVSGWAGLTAMVKGEATEKDKKKDEEKEEASLEAMPWLEKRAAPAPEAKPILSMMASPKLAFAGFGTGGGLPEFSDEVSGQDAAGARAERLAYTAKVLRIAFVGFLTAAFFLSRTYSMSLYVLLGMAGALQLMHRTDHPEEPFALLPTLKRTGVVIAGSVVFLYVFVRLSGGR